jgi:hypothetical protein
MAIAAQCPSCGRKGSVPDQAAGRQVKCPGCASLFTVASTNGAAPAEAAANGKATLKAAAVKVEAPAKPAAWYAQTESATTNGSDSAPAPAATNGSTPAPAPTPAAPAPAAPADGTVAAQCPCGFSGRVPERYKGRQVKCRQCGKMFTVGGDPAPVKELPVPESSNGGPAAKLADTVHDAGPLETDLEPLEEEKPAAAEAGEDIEVLEEVVDPECPLCGQTVKIPPKHKGNKLRCPQCCNMFNIDGTEDDGSEPAQPPVKKSSGSRPGNERIQAEAPEPAPPPVEQAASMFSNLDAPEKGPPRKAALRKREEEEERRKSALMVVSVSGGALLVLAVVVFVVASLMSGEKEKAKADPAPVVAKAKPVDVPTTHRAPLPKTPLVKPPTIPVFPKRDPDPPPPPKRDPEPEPKKDPNPDPQPKKDPDAPAPKPGDWIDASLFPAELGNVRVRVTGAFITDLKQMNLGQQVNNVQDILLVEFDVENRDAQGQMRYLGWGHKLKAEEPVPLMTDNNGLVCRRIVVEDMEIEAVPKPIPARQRLADKLVFVVPDPKADYVRLELPGKNLGLNGNLKIQIPRAMIVTKVAAVPNPDPAPVPKDEKKFKDLRAALKSPQGPTRIKACEGLGAMRAEAAGAVPDLIALYKKEKQGNENVRVAICEALQFIGPAGKQAVPMLVTALEDEFWMVRREAATALGVMKPEPEFVKKAVPLLKKMLKSKDEEVADRARETLRLIDPQGKVR